MEPAIKPALTAVKGKVAVMATPATLKLTKFRQLMKDMEAQDRVIALPCPGLSRLIETTGPDSPAVNDYLWEIAHNAEEPVSAVVVGCTHYSYIVKQMSEAFGGVPVFDGAEGACRRMAELLAAAGLSNPNECGTVRLTANTGRAQDDELLRRFYALAGTDSV